jgi:type I restriction enzyme R subunit
MSYEYSEDGLIENATEQILAALDLDIKTAWHNEKFAVNNDRSTGLLGRFNKSEILLERYLLQALQTQNPDLPAAAYQEVIYKIRETSAGKLLPALNKEKYSLFKD